MRIDHHPQPADDERRNMDADTARRIMEAMDARPLTDVAALNTMVAYLGTPDRIDGWATTKYLADALGDSYDLYWSDLGLLRPCFGNEHAAAVMDGSEIDYTPLFYDTPHVLQIIRMVNLLQDGGKVLSVAEQGDNFSQSYYNRLVARNVLESVYDAPVLEEISHGGMHPLAKQAVYLLVDQDIIGGILQGRDVSETLTQFQAEWPEELLEFRDDLLLASYLSDASAHSAYRVVVNPRNGFIEPAVRPDDAQLTFLFQRHRNGAITLTEDRAELMAQWLPDIYRLRHLLVDELSPYAREDDVFNEVLAQKLSRYGTVGALGEVALFLHDTPTDVNRETVRIASNRRHGNILIRTTTYSSGYGYSTGTSYLPGDGRIWAFYTFGVSGHEYYSETTELPLSSYQHDDPEVTVMQRSIMANLTLTHPENSGLPLVSQEAWRAIHDAENLL